MVNVKFFGTARVKFQTRSLDVDADDVKTLIEKIAKHFGRNEKDLKQFLVYVNEKNITELKMYKTKLADGDTVMFLSPASGG